MTGQPGNKMRLSLKQKVHQEQNQPIHDQKHHQVGENVCPTEMHQENEQNKYGKKTTNRGNQGSSCRSGSTNAGFFELKVDRSYLSRKPKCKASEGHVGQKMKQCLHR